MNHIVRAAPTLAIVLGSFVGFSFGQAPAAPVPARGTLDPTVRALLATQPSTPVQLVRAAKILIELGHAEQAHPYIKQLAGKKLEDEMYAELIDEVGSAILMRMARERVLQPEAGQFCDAALAGARRFARDPGRLTGLVKRLAKADPHERARIVAALRPGGDAAAYALIAALADPARAAEHQQIRAVLAELGSVAAPLLVALLDANDPHVVAQAVDVLGAIEETSVADELLAPALAADSPPEVQAIGRDALAIYFGKLPTHEEAAARLSQRVRSCLQRARPPAFDPAARRPELSVVWRWDPQRKSIVAERATPLAAEVIAALRAATDARRILPRSVRIRRLYLETLAQAIAHAGGEPDEKAAATRISEARRILSETSLDDLQDLFSHALATDQPSAAAIVAGLLGERGDFAVLDTHGRQYSDLVRALAHPDRTLRFAALGAVIKLAGREPFAGSARAIEALAYFARSSGLPRALVAAANGAEAGRIAGLLAELGYEPDIATDVSGIWRLASAAGDYEVIYIDSTLAMPGSGELLQRLRFDSRLARVPLAVVSQVDEFPVVDRTARRLPLCMAVMRTHHAAGTAYELNRVLRATGRGDVSREARRAQGLQALAWIAELAQNSPGLDELRRLDVPVVAVLNAPGMTAAATAALAKLDTPTTQRALVDLASRLTAPLADRQAAAKAFADSVSRRGTLLTSEELQRQYDRYNASETQPVETQQVLGLLLDIIEARAQADALALENPDPAAK